MLDWMQRQVERGLHAAALARQDQAHWMRICPACGWHEATAERGFPAEHSAGGKETCPGCATRQRLYTQWRQDGLSSSTR